ncbi:hypothetical protein [Ornithinibacillus halotolerans]|uniref:Uncharacterized protein n=1 Tax=Ornithinibacillus halotolerans TaxID=1274357 RepID=A0A916S367_9BACI|nr:hypothetical protein [Ornithinibacillus halotolerans]GGA80605.1 hypothetical protein GCM10008025_25010 [Ornithinibacillus halotolerans]
MDAVMKRNFENLHSENKEEQYEAYQNIIEAIEQEVDWAYVVWDDLVKKLEHKNNHERSRAAQFLCGLAAKSDTDKRILNDFGAVWEVTYDEKFVTARHTLQSIWKIGLGGEQQREVVKEFFANRFKECTNEKNYTLIRFDIIQGLRYLYDETKDNEIKELALRLIDTEEDEKYKKKYAKIWKGIA